MRILTGLLERGCVQGSMIRGLIGVIHLPPMPGDPKACADTSFNQVVDFAMRDVDALVAGGVHGIIVENFGSAPFQKGDATSRLPPHQVALMARVVGSCVANSGVPIGVNCLRNDAQSALGIAAATGAEFIRVNVHSGAYLTDQGIIEGEAWRTLRYRKELGVEHVAILADVLVKHAEPLVPVDPVTATEDCLKRGLADGVVVTGRATGQPIERERLEIVHRAADGKPVYLGSGLTLDSVSTLMPFATGAIVGTALKQGGNVGAPVDTERVKLIAEAMNAHLDA